MRPLAYFRALEAEEGVRGDAFDGLLRYAPAEGLQLDMKDGRTINIKGGSFNATPLQYEIFVWCSSNELSSEIASVFGRFCVELSADVLVSRLQSRANATSALDYAKICAGNVEYRSVETKPLADWALPERVAFIKPQHFANQNEYRIAIGKHRAFDVENVELTINYDNKSNVLTSSSERLLLKLGSMHEHSTLHTF